MFFRGFLRGHPRQAGELLEAANARETDRLEALLRTPLDPNQVAAGNWEKETPLLASRWDSTTTTLSLHKFWGSSKLQN